MKKVCAKRSEFGSVSLVAVKGQPGGKGKETRNETNGALCLTLTDVGKPWKVMTMPERHTWCDAKAPLS